MPKAASIQELRRICQDPVREHNDLAGALYGWRISIYVTALLLRLGCSANVASVLMLACGLVGSLLLLVPGWGRVVGLALVTSAFVLDCVDGEMARYQRIDSYRWAAFDYIHHLTVKTLAFLCLGIGLYLEFETPWAMAAGGIGSVFWLALMVIRDLGVALFTKKIVLNEARGRNPAYRRLLANLRRLRRSGGAERTAAAADPWGTGFRFRPWMLRTFLVSFDLAAPLLLAAAVLERFTGSFAIAGVLLTPTLLLLYAYAMILPLHSIDLLHHAMARGRLRDELYDLALRTRIGEEAEANAAEAGDQPAAVDSPPARR